MGKDSAEGIAAELVGAGLVDGRDIVVIAANLQKLIDTQSQCKTVTFPLVSLTELMDHIFLLFSIFVSSCASFLLSMLMISIHPFTEFRVC